MLLFDKVAHNSYVDSLIVVKNKDFSYHENDPLNLIAYKALCQLYEETNEFDKAIETYKKCLDNKLILLEMPQRIDSKPLPNIEMVSLKDVKINTSVFSKKVLNAIKTSLARREQVVIFLNKISKFIFVCFLYKYENKQYYFRFTIQR